MFSKSRFFPVILLIVLLAGLWIAFGPVQFGGPVGYVIVGGSSMEPEFSQGDLILTRREPFPEIGQAVVYQHPQLGFVFHRIIDLAGGTYTLQGDNNDWVDTYTPTGEEIVGSFWVRIPSGGTMITRLRQPIFFSLLSLIMAGLAVSIIYFQNQDQTRKRHGKFMESKSKSTEQRTGSWREDLLLGLAVLGLAGAALAVFAFLRPIQLEIEDNYQYQHSSQLRYTAQDQNDVYDSSRVETGQPIYLQLTCLVDLELDYLLSAPRMTPGNQAQFAGTYELQAVIHDVDGWQRSVPLTDAESFSGTSFQDQAVLDACQIQQLIEDKERKTGTTNRWYSLIIQPEITYEGEILDQDLSGEIIPQFVFQMDSTLMRLPDGVEQLKYTAEDSLENTRLVANTLQIFGMKIEVASARWFSVSVLVFAVLTAVWPLVSLYRDWKSSDVSRIQVQYHPMLVDVKMGSPAEQAEQIVEVASFGDLSRMAERYGAMILHESRGDFHRYSIQDEGTVYQYTLDTVQGQGLFPDLAVFHRAVETALDENQFELYYQPIVNLKDQKVSGIEAFVRWNHPRMGMLYPAEFIDLAEKNGLVPLIDQWVIARGCQQLTEWQEFGLPLVPLSINISPKTILDDGFVEHVQKNLQTTGCQAAYLQLEINRSNQIFQDHTIQDRLQELRRLGFRLAIDNFATDAANQINRVSQIPIQSLKIDRSIMQDLVGDYNNLRLISAVVKMARSLQIEVIAQGVESVQQVALLQEQDISFAQGYLLGDPVPARDMGWKLGQKNASHSEQDHQS